MKSTLFIHSMGVYCATVSLCPTCAREIVMNKAKILACGGFILLGTEDNNKPNE